MLKIFICEDVSSQLQLIKQYVEEYLALKNYDMEVVLALESANEIVEYLKENKGTGLYFLDVGLGVGIDGIDLAVRIRKYDPRGFIVFITVEASEAGRAIQNMIEPLGYILKRKPEDIRKQVGACIDRAWERYTAPSKLQPTFSFTEDGKTVAVELREILYFETTAKTHRITIHTKNETYSFRGDLSDVEKALPSEGFFRCHQSYIVNLDHIITIDWISRTLILQYETKCPVAIRKLPVLQNLLKNRPVIDI